MQSHRPLTVKEKFFYKNLNHINQTNSSFFLIIFILNYFFILIHNLIFIFLFLFKLNFFVF